MKNHAVPQPLADILRTYCDVNASELVEALRDHVAQGALHEDVIRGFRQQLADAIVYGTMTPTDYKALTGDNEFNTPGELNLALRQLWTDVFADEPIPGDQ